MPNFADYREALREKVRARAASNGNQLDLANIEDYPEKGAVRRELYPWNHHEPDRFSPDALQFLNDEMEQIAPKLEVKIAELPLLRYVLSVNHIVVCLLEKPVEHSRPVERSCM